MLSKISFVAFAVFDYHTNYEWKENLVHNLIDLFFRIQKRIFFIQRTQNLFYILVKLVL